MFMSCVLLLMCMLCVCYVYVMCMLCAVLMTGEKRKPSSEWRFHGDIYAEKDVQPTKPAIPSTTTTTITSFSLPCLKFNQHLHIDSGSQSHSPYSFDILHDVSMSQERRSGTYIHTYIRAYIHTYIHMCVHMYIYIKTHQTHIHILYTH